MNPKSFTLHRLIRRVLYCGVLLLVCTGIASRVIGQNATTATGAADATAAYNQLVTAGRKALDAGKSQEALVSVAAAIEKLPDRFEAYVLGGMAAQAKGDLVEARKYYAKALEKAPTDKKAAVQDLAKKVEEPVVPAKPTVPQAVAKTDPTKPNGVEDLMSPELRRKYDVLSLIVEEADKAKSPEERVKLLTEFLSKSGEFVKILPTHTNIWVLRATIAVELNDPRTAWEAGRKLNELGLSNSPDPSIRKLMAQLDRKGWMAPTDEQIVKIEGVMVELREAMRKTQAEITNATAQVTAFQEQIAGLSAKNTASDDFRKALSSWRVYLRVQETNSDKIKKAMDSANPVSTIGLETVSPPDVYLAGREGAMVTELANPDFLKLKTKAASGDIEAQKSLAKEYLLYHWGRVAHDDKQGFDWTRKAAEAGDPEAQYSLALLFKSGVSVPKNEAEGMVWLRRAAEGGDKYAQLGLATMYLKGEGVPKDMQAVHKWWRKAAEQNEPSAMINLGSLYMDGDGIEKDLVEAEKWLLKAADLGYPQARKKLDQLRSVRGSVENETVAQTVSEGQANDEVAVIKTSRGEMVVELWPDAAPKTVASFKKLAKDGFYNGTAFHRVIKGFMIQGGDPLSKDEEKRDKWGTGGPGFKLKAEINGKKHIKGTVSLAHAADINSGGSQFFICLDKQDQLDKQFTAFGWTKSFKVLEAIGKVSTDGKDRPLERVEIESIRIVPRGSVK